MRLTAGLVETPVADRFERARDGVAVLCALLIGLVIASPLAVVPFFQSHDGLVHLWRIWEYARAAEVVGPIVRWAPDIAYGFGAPQFTFYNPLTYASGALLMAMGSSAGDATKWLFALSIVGSSLSAYWLGAAWSGKHNRLAGLCAALIYTSAPYRVATVYQRGALAEAIGCAIAPVVILAALRIARTSANRGVGWRGVILRNGPPIAWLGLATGAIVMAHTIAALLTLPFAGLIGLAALIEAPNSERRQGLLRLFLGFALGLALSAHYWFPAFSQQSSVHLERARWSGETYRFVSGFAWPWQLVQPSLVHDYARDVDPSRPQAARFPRAGGAAAVLLVAGAAIGIASGRLRRPTGIVVLSTVVASIALASPIAIPIWERVDLLASVQLGWRFLSLVMLAAIPIAGGMVDFGSMKNRFLPATDRLALVGMLLVLVSAGGAIYGMTVERLEWSRAIERPFELNAYERKTGEFALGALREYVPRWTETSPEDLTYRATPETVPGDADIQIHIDPEAAARGLRAYNLDASTATTMVFDTFFHPGIGVKIDGRFVETWPTGDDGLVTFDMPSGRHSVELTPRSTANDTFGTALSAVSLVLAAALLLAGRFPLTLRSIPAIRLGATVFTITIPVIFLIGPFVPISALTSRPPARSVVGSAPVDLGRDLRVIAAIVESNDLASDGIVRLDLHMLARRGFARNLPLRLKLIDGNGQTVADAMGSPGGGFRPTTRWRPNELLRARSELHVPDGTAPGTYRLQAEFDGNTGIVGELTVPALRTSGGAIASPLVQHESVFGDGLVLDGYVHPRAPPSNHLHGTFWWRWVHTPTVFPLTAVLRLVDKQGNVLASDSQLIGGSGNPRPTADFDLTYPSLAAESYRLELLVMDKGKPLPARAFGGQTGDAVVLTWFDVRDPCNCVPAIVSRIDRRFGDGIVFLGAETTRVGDILDVSLYWRADRNPTENYTLFLHVLDGDRTMLQVDSEPNGGRRPTGSWQTGEIIRDHYRLRLPSGSVNANRLGLYRSSNGTRLTLDPPTPDNAVTIPLQFGP